MDTYRPNLKATTTCCPLTPDVKQELIELKCKIPANTDIVGRFLGLFEGRQDRITKLSEEFLKLWEMIFPFFHNKQQQIKSTR